MKKTLVLLIMLVCGVITVNAQSNLGAHAMSTYNLVRVYDANSKEWSSSVKNEKATFLSVSDDGKTFKVTNTTYDATFIIGSSITREDGNISMHLGDTQDLSNVSLTFFTKEHFISLTYFYSQKWYNVQYYCTSSGLD